MANYLEQVTALPLRLNKFNFIKNMILYIDSSVNNTVHLSLTKDEKLIAKKDIELNRLQSEKTLAEIEKLLKESNLELKDINGIKVNNKKGTFTSLRSSVVIANTLAYILNIPINENDDTLINSNNGISIVKPLYNRDPIVDNHK